MSALCDAKSGVLYCTLDRGHGGQHKAHGLSGAVLRSWPEQHPASNSESRKRLARDPDPHMWPDPADVFARLREAEAALSRVEGLVRECLDNREPWHADRIRAALDGAQ